MTAYCWLIASKESHFSKSQTFLVPLSQSSTLKTNHNFQTKEKPTTKTTFTVFVCAFMWKVEINFWFWTFNFVNYWKTIHLIKIFTDSVYDEKVDNYNVKNKKKKQSGWSNRCKYAVGFKDHAIYHIQYLNRLIPICISQRTVTKRPYKIYLLFVLLTKIPQSFFLLFTLNLSNEKKWIAFVCVFSFSMEEEIFYSVWNWNFHNFSALSGLELKVMNENMHLITSMLSVFVFVSKYKDPLLLSF